MVNVLEHLIENKRTNATVGFRRTATTAQGYLQQVPLLLAAAAVLLRLQRLQLRLL